MSDQKKPDEPRLGEIVLMNVPHTTPGAADNETPTGRKVRLLRAVEPDDDVAERNWTEGPAPSAETNTWGSQRPEAGGNQMPRRWSQRREARSGAGNRNRRPECSGGTRHALQEPLDHVPGHLRRHPSRRETGGFRSVGVCQQAGVVGSSGTHHDACLVLAPALAQFLQKPENGGGVD